MHMIQKELLKASDKHNLTKIGYRKIGALIGVDHPQKVKWHLDKLIRDGKLVKDTDGSWKQPASLTGSKHMALIPILGRANCGEPLSIAEENHDDVIQVSKSLLPRSNQDKCFAIKAVGESMNRAQIAGQPILSGDLAIVDGSAIEPKDGDYVVASIDGLATIKKYRFDKDRGRIILSAESSQDFNPIIVSSETSDGYLVHGKVIDVIPLSA